METSNRLRKWLITFEEGDYMSKGQKKISMKEIAALSNVSIATVSRVLNNTGRFSEETRKRVLKVIKENGYAINSVAKTLREHKSNTVGIIVPDINNDFFSYIVREMEKELFKEGYSVFICNTDRDQEKEIVYWKSLISKLVDGVICISGREFLPQDIISSQLPIVCIDRSPKLPDNFPITTITSDNFHGGYLAVEHLILRDCRELLILTNIHNLSSVNERIEGGKQACRDYSDKKVHLDLVKLERKKPGFIESRLKMAELIRSGFHFDGVFATNDWLAEGTIKGLYDAHINVPEDVKVIGFDDISMASYVTPSLSTIRQNKKELAVAAARTLMSAMTEQVSWKNNIVIPVSLIKRQST